MRLQHEPYHNRLSLLVNIKNYSLTDVLYVGHKAQAVCNPPVQNCRCATRNSITATQRAQSECSSTLRLMLFCACRLSLCIVNLTKQEDTGWLLNVTVLVCVCVCVCVCL